MLKDARHLLADHPVVRASTLAILFFGFAGASTAPFVSVLGIRQLGIGNLAYSATIFAASVVNVLASVAIGMMADRRHNFRSAMMAVSAIGCLGHLMIWLFPGPLCFVLATAGPVSVFYALNTLLFANIPNHAAGMNSAQLSDSVTVVRMAISIAWVVVPGLIAMMLPDPASVVDAWGVAGIACFACLIVVWKMMPADRNPERDPPSKARHENRPASARTDAMQLFAPRVLGRLLGVALITSTLYVNGTILPLIVTERAGGTMSDVGVIVGMVAAIEALLMLVWAQIARRLDPTATLGIAVLFYSAYLLWLGMLSSRWEAYAASVVGGIGAAAIVSQPIGYLLGILRDKPGLSASLFSVNLFVAAGLGAGLFALGTSLGGYGTVAVLGASAGIAGTVLLLCLEGWRLRPAPESLISRKA